MLVGAVQATIRPQKMAHIAYEFYSEFQRKGYAREATQALIAHLRDAYGVRKVYAEMDTRNVPSYRLVESLGFARIDTRAGEDLGQGSEAQEYLYALTL